MTTMPILFSFRRCPYAMRARMALLSSGIAVRLREVVLRDKPVEMLDASPKGTVPVLVGDDGAVIEESLELMLWALAHKDPGNWLEHRGEAMEIIKEADGDFKFHLDRYKYPVRYDDVDPAEHRAAGLEILERWNARIAEQGGQLIGSRPGLADYAIFPFVRQFANHDRVWFDALPLAELQRWLDQHLESEIFRTTMAKYPQWKTGDAEPVFGAMAA